MQEKTKPLWFTLCEQAAVEQDPVRLLELVQEINRLLEEKEQMLLAASRKETSTP